MPPPKATPVAYSALPALGKPLQGGTFAGLTTRADGAHCAVILLPEQGSELTHTKARNWAKKLGGELPSRPVAALLFANAKPLLRPTWHWTSDTNGASYAWSCYFGNGTQYNYHKSFEGSAVAVRLIPLVS